MARLLGGFGRIPTTIDPAALRAAKAQQIARSRKGGQLQGAARTQAIIAAMAEEIVARAVANDNCSKADLLQAGFQPDDVEAFGDRAVARAGRMAPNLRFA